MSVKGWLSKQRKAYIAINFTLAAFMVAVSVEELHAHIYSTAAIDLVLGWYFFFVGVKEQDWMTE